jgi:hypothetical protein
MNSETEALILKIAVDKSDFDKKIADVKKIARDTKKELDINTVLKMEIDRLSIERKLLVVKELLKNPELTTLEITSLKIDKNRLERDLSEVKRTMNNYLNT